MTTTWDLGTIVKVDIRDVWPTEGGHFTPWLAESENLKLLGNALGIDLEDGQTEVPVGNYSLDILARDAGNNRAVVIENQYGETDHDHLGKLLTYAGGFDAYSIVWISEKFRDEHREALDLLNRRTAEDTAFFGVVVEAIRIDESRPAVNFDLVVVPNDWQKRNIINQQSGNVSERDARYRVFFQGLIDELRNLAFTSRRTARPNNSSDFSSNFSGIRYIAHFQWPGAVRVATYIDRSDPSWNKSLFERLQERKESLESELGETLEWDYEESRRSCAVQVVRQGSIDDDEETLEEIRTWMVERLLKFREVFGPRLAELVD